ncbi:MAG: extracellular solute-binding protein, partial [Clostridiales bacterium]|nr:extracellular solute-binding protein [Clostridiales bacterium]
KKKLTAMIATTVMAATVGLSSVALAACGGDTGASKEGRLAIWVGEQLEEMFQKIAADYTKETGFPVVVNTYTGLTASDKLALDGPFGKGGDVYVQGGGGDLAQSIEKGLFKELSATEMELETKFISGAQGLMQYKGKLYGVPLGIETNAMFYNKDLIPADVLPTLFDTWEGMVEWAKSYNDFVGVKSKNQKFGLLIDYTNPYYTWAINEAFGGYIFGKDAEGNWNPQDIGIDTDGSIEATKLIKGLIDDQVIPTDMAITLMQSKFTSKKAAILLDGSWDLANFRKAGINVGIAPIPSIKISDTERGTPVAFSGGYGLAVNSYSLNPTESVDFLKFATRDEYVLEYYKVTGRIPSTKGCEKIDEVANDECLKGFYEQLVNSYPQPSINEMNAVWDPLTAAASAIFTNNEDVSTVLHKVKNDVLENIKLLNS